MIDIVSVPWELRLPGYTFFAFLKREGFISTNVIAKVTMSKIPEVMIPTFSEKDIRNFYLNPIKPAMRDSGITAFS